VRTLLKGLSGGAIIVRIPKAKRTEPMVLFPSRKVMAIQHGNWYLKIL
jgi:hypothetical protein